jgi:hypothetical protein
MSLRLLVGSPSEPHRPTLRRPARAGRLCLVLAGLTACGGGDLALPNQGQPATIELVRGDRQSGTIGEALVDSLVVRVKDPFGDPVNGATITWTAEVGGSVNPATSVTSAQGMAATQRVLGVGIGTYVTTAALQGEGDLPEPVVFVTTGVAARLVLTQLPPAAATAGVVLDPQPTLQLVDVDGNDIARDRVAVTAAIGAGGGSVTGTTTATSDPTGRVAFTDLTLRGSLGTQQIIFSAEGFASTTATVALGVGAPASIEAAAGAEQSATVGTAVAVAPAVLVRDTDGNPLAGVPVTFKVTGGGGSLSGDTPVTASNGIAAVSGWALGQEAGANSLSATLAGLEVTGSPVVFTATATPGAVDAERSRVSATPDRITASSGSSRSTITVTARDAFDNPVPGLAVTLSASGAGAALVQPSAPTGSDGSTTGQLSATVPGDHQVSASIAGTNVSQTATVSVASGAPNAGRSGATVPNGRAGERTTVEIRLRDVQDNDVPGRADAIAVSVSGANAGAVIAKSDEGGGRYLASYTPTKSGTDQVQVRVSGTGVPGSPFASTVLAGPAAADRSTANVPACVNFFNLPATVTITAFDRFGNRVNHGGDPFRVAVNQGTPLVPTDNGNGTYARNLDLSVGVFRIDITLGGQALSGNPFQILVPFPFSGCPGNGGGGIGDDN